VVQRHRTSGIPELSPSTHTDRVAEVLGSGPDRPRWSPPRWFVISAALLVVVAATVTAVADRRGDGSGRPSGNRVGVQPRHARPAPSEDNEPVACGVSGSESASPTAWSRLSAVVLGPPEPGGTLTRSDSLAGRGPWTVIVRRRDGSLARHGAVVTYPVTAVAGRPMSRGRPHGTAAYRQVVWPLGGAHARVRGDVGTGTLLAIAARTSVVSGRPVVRPTRGYVVTGPLPYRPKEVHEVRYRDRGGLGAYGTRLGFVYTGVFRAGAFEDQLYTREADPAGTVHRWPAVASIVMGGNATVAWSPSPGLVAYIGYSGVTYDAAAKAALTCLARRSRPLSEAGWRATAPTVVPQRNDVG
jgi:hypothetical protein